MIVPAETPDASASSLIFRPGLSLMRGTPAGRRAPGGGTTPVWLSRWISSGVKPASARTALPSAPSVGPPRPGSAGVRESLTGVPSRRTGPGARLLDLDDHLARAHELGLQRLVELQHRLEAAVVLVVERPPLGAGALREHRLDLAVHVRADGLELALDQVLAADAATPRGPELRLERSERDPAVGAAVGAVADEPAGELGAAALRARARRPGSGPRPSPATTARRRSSRRRRAGPRRTDRARAAPPGSRTRPSARRRRDRRSGRPPAPARRRRRRSARAGR